MLTDKLVSFWQLEEASGTRFDSVVASANNLTDNNTVTQQTGIVGMCGQFTRANSEFLSKSSNASLQPGPDFTISCWAHFTDDPGGNLYGMVSKDSGGSTGAYLSYVSGGKLELIVIDSASGSATASVTNWGFAINTWFNFIMTYSSSDKIGRVYVNNTFTAASTALTNGIRVNGSSDVFIGSTQSAANFMNGRIDQVGYWQRVLNTNEMAQLFNYGNGLSYQGLLTLIGPRVAIFGAGQQ